jgi:hypothetical protein
MLLGIGFLTACVTMVVLAPLIHQRAVRLTTQRNLATQPMSVVEMRAHNDQQRAEFAMATRRLEMSIEELRAKLAGQQGEIGRSIVEVELLKTQLRHANVALLEGQARELARKSMAHRIVRLFVYLLVRSRRQQALRASTPLFRSRKLVQA